MFFGNQIEWNNRFSITGMSRTGKSWLRDWITKRYIEKNKRGYYVVIDSQLINAENLYKKENFKIQEINKKMKNISKTAIKNFIIEYKKVYFVIEELSLKECQSFINKVCQVIKKLKDTLLEFDEPYNFFDVNNCPSELITVYRSGAKHGIDLISSSQRLIDVPPTLVSQANIYIAFRNTEPNTLNRLKKYYSEFNKPNLKLIDSELKSKDKKKAKKIIKKYNKPSEILRNLPNRFFLYSDVERGIQEISSTNILTI